MSSLSLLPAAVSLFRNKDTYALAGLPIKFEAPLQCLPLHVTRQRHGHTFCFLPAALGPLRGKAACRQVCPLALRQGVIVQSVPTGPAHPLEPLRLQALQA